MTYARRLPPRTDVGHRRRPTPVHRSGLEALWSIAKKNLRAVHVRIGGTITSEPLSTSPWPSDLVRTTASGLSLARLVTGLHPAHARHVSRTELRFRRLWHKHFRGECLFAPDRIGFPGPARGGTNPARPGGRPLPMGPGGVSPADAAAARSRTDPARDDRHRVGHHRASAPGHRRPAPGSALNWRADDTASDTGRTVALDGYLLGAGTAGHGEPQQQQRLWGGSGRRSARPGRHRSADNRDRRRGHRNTRNLGIRSTCGSVTLSNSASRR